MDGLLGPVVEFLDDQGWAYESLDERAVLSFPFRGDRDTWTCFAEAFEDQQRVVFYSVVPFNVPEEGRPGVMEFITRANYGLLIGNFELDLADGEVRFKTGLDVRGATLTATLAGRAIIPNLHAMNTYLPGLEALIGDDPAAPAEVVADIESG